MLFVFTPGQESRADVGDTRETATDLALDTPYTETADAATVDPTYDLDYFRIEVAQSVVDTSLFAQLCQLLSFQKRILYFKRITSFLFFVNKNLKTVQTIVKL